MDNFYTLFVVIISIEMDLNQGENINCAELVIYFLSKNIKLINLFLPPSQLDCIKYLYKYIRKT